VSAAAEAAAATCALSGVGDGSEEALDTTPPGLPGLWGFDMAGLDAGDAADTDTDDGSARWVNGAQPNGHAAGVVSHARSAASAVSNRVGMRILPANTAWHKSCPCIPSHTGIVTERIELCVPVSNSQIR
jgi:hypothetical protein